jgi:hypothetical protein
MMAAGLFVCGKYKLTVITYNTVTHFDASYQLGQIATDVTLFPTTVTLVTLNVCLAQCEIHTEYAIKYIILMPYSNVLPILVHQNHHCALFITKVQNVSTLAT